MVNSDLLLFGQVVLGAAIVGILVMVVWYVLGYIIFDGYKKNKKDKRN